jgi:hypothetical protein
MENVKSREEIEQQAIADARNGMLPNPAADQIYMAAYNYYKSQNQPAPPQQPAS